MEHFIFDILGGYPVLRWSDIFLLRARSFWTIQNNLFFEDTLVSLILLRVRIIYTDLVDYSKAFDTMEWDFISKCLRPFKFGDNLINMVRLLQKDSFSKIEQNVFFSDNIILERGCRKGDLVLPYLFVLSAEILSTAIRKCEDVRGLRVGTKEAKISLYADDTTLFSKKDKYTVKKL